MKKIVMSLCAALCAVMLAQAASAETVIKIGHVLNSDHSWHKNLSGFAEDVKKGTEGRVVIQLYPSAQLGNEKDMVEGLTLGMIDGGLIGGGSFQSIDERFGIEALPYAWPTHEAAYKAFDGKLGEFLFKLLNEKGIPVVCETDIHGAVTALLVEAAGMDEMRSFFADWTIRHPDIENGELLQHCGPWPVSVAKEKPELTYPLAFDHPGSLTAEAKHGDVTLCRFDGDNGEYSLLLGNAKGVDGPKGMGTYLWVEVENIKRLEAKIVEGPYIHHCVGIHKDVVPVLYEACKYIGVKPDLYDPIEEDVKAYLRGE